MTTSTTNFIHGNAPYLTFDDGQSRVTDMSNLLGISLSDGRTYSPNNNSATNPIVLPEMNETLINVNMLVPTNVDSIALNTLIGAPYNYWWDDDGDGQGSNGIAVTGNLTLTITDKNNKKVLRNTALDICNAPYKVVLSSDGGTLSTQYGVPNSTNFNASRATYYINPKALPKLCFVRPELKFGSDKVIKGTDFGGPASMWNPNKGFIPQSKDPSSYGLNFPTTGANNLYFYLELAGKNSLSWASPISRGGITATITPNSSGTSVRVKLTGPFANESQWRLDSPARITKPTLPQTFELAGKDSKGNVVVKYGFQIKKWFVNRGTVYQNYSNTLSWCNSIGYRIVKVQDLTNASCNGKGSGSHCQGAVGVKPSSLNNNYQRRIGGGLFSEWGYMNNYTGANFDSDYHDSNAQGKQNSSNSSIGHAYWTSDPIGNDNFVVSSSSGYINRFSLDYGHDGVCTYP